MAQLLYTTAYKKPGCYIGQIIEPSADSIGTASRIPVMIGKGSRYAQATNSAIVRAYIYEEQLTNISAVAPYTAVLEHSALKDQSKAELVRKVDGYVIPESKWYFDEETIDGVVKSVIVISEDVYQVDSDYTFSYQSTDRNVLDPTPVLDIISIGSCGSSISTSNFVENRDYYILMELGNLKKIVGTATEETDDLDFDPRYNNTSLYPTKECNKDWFTVDVEKYKGMDNLELTLSTVLIQEEDPETQETVIKGVEVKEDGTTIATINEAGTFVELNGYAGVYVTVPVIDSTVVADDISLKVNASKIFPTAKDNRKVTITVKNSQLVDGKYVYTIYYASNTPEGGFGTVTSKDDRIVLPGNIILKLSAAALTTPIANEAKYSFELTNMNVIDWNLTLKASQYFRADSVYRDVNGSKTGVPGSYYVILNGTPISEPIAEGVIGTPIEGTPYVAVAYPEDSANAGKKPQNFSVSYEYAGNEPNPGDTYYLTTKHIRPDSMFNKVIFVSSRAEGEMLLAPSTAKNDLYIANEIAWDEIGINPGRQIAYIQIKDSDDDGVLSSADVQTAIDALAKSKKVTDFCLLGNFEYLGKLLAANEFGNDPFECRENEVWVGAPTGTEVGDINTEGSLVYIAQSSMKVYGNENPAHGTRILVGATEATKRITLEGNIEQSVKLDGSFVAWGLACHRSRMRPSTSILREVLVAFDELQTYDDVDDITLGSNQILYFSKVGDSMYRVEEDFTTDKYSFDFSIEQVTSQRLQVVRDIRNFMNESLIGYTPDTPQDGVNTVVSFLAQGLQEKIKDGTIAPYQDEKGNKRELDPNKDIFVTYVKNKPNQYQFGYGFYTKKAIKQLFGSYVVDKDFKDTGLGN